MDAPQLDVLRAARIARILRYVGSPLLGHLYSAADDGNSASTSAIPWSIFVTTVDGRPGPGAKGLVLHSAARYYDLLAWLLTLGREGRFRDRLVELARLEPGHAVLDVGCGTGTLAVSAKRRVGLTGTVHGVDASPEMIERARRKSAKAGVEVTFEIGTVEALPFPDARFDAVLSTLMLHHLPRPVRQQ